MKEKEKGWTEEKATLAPVVLEIRVEAAGAGTAAVTPSAAT